MEVYQQFVTVLHCYPAPEPTRKHKTHQHQLTKYHFLNYFSDKILPQKRTDFFLCTAGICACGTKQEFFPRGKRIVSKGQRGNSKLLSVCLSRDSALLLPPWFRRTPRHYLRGLQSYIYSIIQYKQLFNVEKTS